MSKVTIDNQILHKQLRILEVNNNNFDAVSKLNELVKSGEATIKYNHLTNEYLIIVEGDNSNYISNLLDNKTTNK